MSAPEPPKVHQPNSAPPPYTPLPPQGAQPGYPPQAPPGYGPHTAPPTAPPAYGFAHSGPPPPGHPQTAYGTTYVNMPPPTEVIILNGCPNCRAGVLEDEYSCLGIFCAIFFFPLGVLCCLLTRERRCTNCRAVY